MRRPAFRSSALLGPAIGMLCAAATLLTYAPDLEASQDHALERKLEVLEQQNRALLERLEDLDAAALVMAPKAPEAAKDPAARRRRKARKARKPSSKSESPGNQTTNQETPPKGVTEANAEFRMRVLKALKRELEQLEDVASDVAELETDVASLQTHTHQIALPARSPRAYIAKDSWEVIPGDAMIPYVPQESVGKARPDQTFTTTAPQ